MLSVSGYIRKIKYVNKLTRSLIFPLFFFSQWIKKFIKFVCHNSSYFFIGKKNE